MTGPPGRTSLDGLPPVKAGPGSVPQGSAVVEDHAHLRVGRRQDEGFVLAQASDEPVLVLRHRQAHRGDAARPARVGEVRRARVDGEVRHEKREGPGRRGRRRSRDTRERRKSLVFSNTAFTRKKFLSRFSI